ncbi:ABC transporter permease [Nonomuraea africana]|uniref:ABC transporter permease n=1 Tax=Nonomuraea africana TaxID=46171 RepID=UPI0033CCA95E
MTAVAVEVTSLVRRNLIHLRRRPELLVFSIVEPVVLVLLFRYVFGGAVGLSTDLAYADFMVPGILVQTVTLGSITIGAGLAQDLRLGLMDRFRSLPISRVSVVASHALAGLLRSSVVVLVMALVGVAVGFRPAANPLQALLALILLWLYGVAMAWVTLTLALILKSVEATETIGLGLLFPLTMLSSAFVPIDTLPGPLRAFADHQPVTAAIDATRALLLDQPVGGDLWAAVAWSLAIVAALAPVTAMLYRRRVDR